MVMISFESSNPIYGETGNPHNKDFCPGGSSSGEGCLIAAGGSILGFGSDMAGSIRAPSHLCGICGLKPSQFRLGLKGFGNPLPGHTDISASYGPMARDVDTLALAMKSLLCDFLFQRDCSVPPLPFNDAIYKSRKPLRIGYYFDNGYMKAAPACERAVLIAKQHLEDAGHTLVKFEIPQIERAMQITLEAIFADGGKTLDSFAENEVLDKRIKYLFKNFYRNSVLRWLISKAVGFKYPRLAHAIMSYGGKGSVYEAWQLTASIYEYQGTFFQQWESQNLDAMICPSYPVAACPKGSVANLAAMMSYTVLYNLLNFPAGVVTITEVNDKDISDLDNYQGHYNDPWDWHIKKVSKHSLGMPVSVQCVAKRWNEEMCLRVMKEVESAAKKQFF